MEALVPALVAALLAGFGDRPATRTARLAGVHGAAFALITAALVHATVVALAAGGGALTAPILNPNAKALLVGLALVLAGAAGLRGRRRDDGRPGGVIGGPLDLWGMALTDRTAFITFALAVRGPSPLLAAAGAWTGAMLLAIVAVSIGERDWHRLPRAAVIGTSALLLMVGLVIGLGALRLI